MQQRAVEVLVLRHQGGVAYPDRVDHSICFAVATPTAAPVCETYHGCSHNALRDWRGHMQAHAGAMFPAQAHPPPVARVLICCRSSSFSVDHATLSMAYCLSESSSLALSSVSSVSAFLSFTLESSRSSDLPHRLQSMRPTKFKLPQSWHHQSPSRTFNFGAAATLPAALLEGPPAHAIAFVTTLSSNCLFDSRLAAPRRARNHAEC